MRPVAYGLQAVLAALALTTLAARKRVNSKLLKMLPSGKHVFFAAVTLVFSLAMSLVVAEGLLRLFHLPFQSKWNITPNALSKFDPELGWSYIPGQSVMQEFGADRRKVPMYFDNIGSRVRKPGDRANPAAPTVLFVGDSFTFGHGVTYEESFVGRLAARPDFPWQVVNLGVQAYGTDQALLMLKRHFKSFNVKAVVYNFIFLQVDRNEIYDVRIPHPRTVFVGTKPKFALEQGGALYLANAPVEYKNLSYSHLWACLQIFNQRWGPKPSVRLTRALVEEMKVYVESRGAKFVVIDWDQWSSRVGKPVWKEGEFPWGLDVDVIRPAANGPPGWSTWIIPGDGHPDPRQHLYVSQLVANELERSMRGEGEVLAPGQKRSGD